MKDYWNPNFLDIHLIEGELKRNNISYNLNNDSLSFFLPGVDANLLLGNDNEITEKDIAFYKDMVTDKIIKEILRVLNELRKIYSA